MEGSGSLPDGAFERFVTSALAAIITILFSWRLLAEGQEQLEGETRPRFPPRPIQEVKDEDEQPPVVDIPIDEHITPSLDSRNLAAPQKYATLDKESVSGKKTQEEKEEVPSWGEYSWEEEYDTVHTRRTVQDFITKPRNSDSTSSDEIEMDSDVQLSPIPASHEMLEKLYMNQEYRSIIDEQNDSSSDSSEDDDELIEGVYETPEFDQDMYYASGLEPIIEEDSDDFSEEENEDVSENKNGTFVVNSDNEPEGTRQDLVKHQSNENLTFICPDDMICQDEKEDSDKVTVDNYIDECFDNLDGNLNEDESDSFSDKSDSLPPSPIIRTCAIDEEYANLSDESCSSGSVITVVSVKSDFSDTPEIRIVEESNKPLSFIYSDNESSISENLKAQDILSFIHGSNEQLASSFDPNKTPDNELLEEEIKNTKTKIHYEDFIRDINAVSETNIETVQNENNLNNSPSLTEQEPKNDANEIPIQSLEIENKISPLLCKSGNSFEDKFDDDVGPREYNPYEDDFAEFEYCDSDDDSFYLVVGESDNLQNFQTFNKRDTGNLRNFETFDSLDTIGLASPGLHSPCESGLLEDGRYIFSRTEEISTEYRTRAYVKDRDTDSIIPEVEHIKEIPELNSDVENKNSYNESLLCNSEESVGPIITELENIELFIDENKIVDLIKDDCNTQINEDTPSLLASNVDNSSCIVNHSASDIHNSQSELMDERHENDLTVKSDQFNYSPLRTEKTDINGNDRAEEGQRSNEVKHEHSSVENKIPKQDDKKYEISENCSSVEKITILDDDRFGNSENCLSKQERDELDESLKPCIDILSRAHDSGIDLDSEHSKCDSTEDCTLSPSSNTRIQILDLLHGMKSQIDRSSAEKPSFYKSGSSKARIKQQNKNRSKSYVSVLQQPVSLEGTRNVAVVLPENSPSIPKSRQQIIASRKNFLSEQNLFSDKTQEQFQQHKTSFEETAQRKPRFLRRGNSLPKSSRTHKSYDKLDFNSLNSSRSSVERPNICALHENCIFSPQKHQEILNRTLSIDNLESSLTRYGSVTSLVETDIDSGETTEYQIFTDFDNDFEFQLPLERTASMSDIASRIKHKKESKGRFSDRNVPKSKSLCTLETDIDEVFNDDTPSPGTLGRVPSVHELRVTKSLQKLNVPDWYKKSSVSRSGSTWSLYSSPRKDSFSSYNFPPSITSSPCPSVSLASNSVVIRTRVTPSSAKLFRTPKLQTTPEKSPTPIKVQLPSEKLRQKEKPKELMPIPIVPFSKLRLMFESSTWKKAPSSLATKTSPTSPTTPCIESTTTPVSPSIAVPTAPLSPSIAAPTFVETKVTPTLAEKSTTKPIKTAKPILKKTTVGTTENTNVVRVEPQQATPLSVQPMSTSPRSPRRVETTFNGTVGQSEVRKSKETTIDGDKPVQVVRPKVQEQSKTPQTQKSNTAENQNEHSSKSARYSSLSKSLKSAFRRPQKPSTVEKGGSKIETVV